MEKYFLRLLTIIISMLVWLGPPICLDNNWILAGTWIPALFIFIALNEVE